jgi:pyrimidine operon attenuation protein / uracil phosphoribosyltransferase
MGEATESQAKISDFLTHSPASLASADYPILAPWKQREEKHRLVLQVLYICLMQKNYILSEAVAEKKLQRMAYEILENNFAERAIVLAGIRESGSVIARNIQRLLSGIAKMETELLTILLDKKNPREVQLDKPVSVNNKIVIIVDDVANSGKTLLYAIKPFLDFHPKKIQALVLVERRHNDFPVKPDYVGLSISTTVQEHIYVEIAADRVKGAWLE